MVKSIRGRYLHMPEFAHAEAFIHLHPPHHHRDGPLGHGCALVQRSHREQNSNIRYWL